MFKSSKTLRKYQQILQCGSNICEPEKNMLRLLRVSHERGEVPYSTRIRIQGNGQAINPINADLDLI